MSIAQTSNPCTFDPLTDTLTIFGVKYSVGLFMTLGLGPTGGTFRIVERNDGVVTLQAIYPADETSACQELLTSKTLAETAQDLREEYLHLRRVVETAQDYLQGEFYAEALGVLDDAITGASVETSASQAPIAKLIVPDGVSGGAPLQVEMYAPGLPPGEHDLYCEPEAIAPYMRSERCDER